MAVRRAAPGGWSERGGRRSIGARNDETRLYGRCSEEVNLLRCMCQPIHHAFELLRLRMYVWPSIRAVEPWQCIIRAQKTRAPGPRSPSYAYDRHRISCIYAHARRVYVRDDGELGRSKREEPWPHLRPGHELVGRAGRRCTRVDDTGSGSAWVGLLQCPGVKPAGMGVDELHLPAPPVSRRIELDIRMLRDSVFVCLCGLYSFSASV
jgi:hypothetical protein